MLLNPQFRREKLFGSCPGKYSSHLTARIAQLVTNDSPEWQLSVIVAGLKMTRFRRSLLLSCFLMLVVGAAAASLDAKSQIEAEIERLEQSAKSQPADDDYWKDLAVLVSSSLDRADKALRAGNLYLSLEEMGRARVLLDSFEYTKQSPEVLKQGLQGFELAWRTVSRELANSDREARKRIWKGKPAVLRALAEAAQGKSLTLVEASRAYATVTDPKAGYYYLGEARAQAEFARFCYSLELPMQGAAFVGHSMRPQIERLQEQINAAFVPPRSIERHRDFILLNSTLKVASELDAAKLYAGALYQYLSAVQQLARLNAGSETSASPQLQQGIAEARKRLSTAKRDDSIAELFLQRAEFLAGEKESDSLTKAAVIADQVLPAYYAAEKSAPMSGKKAANPVTVTLVRWPYT